MKAYIRPMLARDPDEGHRAATPLELLFDLASVVAIAAASVGLHHAIADAHALDGVIRFVMAFFAIWWAWMNYTWFASAYDNEDALFRVLSMVMIGGSIVIAAGIDPLFKSLDLTTVILGYVITRVPLIFLWLRAAMADATRRQTCLRYAVGIAVAQIFWISLLFMPDVSMTLFLGVFLLGVLIELAVPALAERSVNTSWHRHHIIERYGLLTIIVLGEVLLAAYIALQSVFGETTDMSLIRVAVYAVTVMAAMWWLYFSDEDHLDDTNLGRALSWGYGHFLVFGSAAAVGAGFAVMVDVVTDHARIDMQTAVQSVAIPLALYMFSLWLIRDRVILRGLASFIPLIFAGLVLVTVFVPVGFGWLTVLSIACVVIRNALARAQGLADLGDAS
ncbi:low temperature requirement protein A [Algimonas porphyrae]|uniref:Low temperature requirement protein A n=1 Tax=Algimonas porphyrae TaxID=1128113 RepID=A0ABQ5V0A3_9PROT|nr:low temperature requirement protein A [Algimonas porphyrae]GLQ20440.1 hypothetical protein GCM10007854_13950 [Algimonas porphyrae]